MQCCTILSYVFYLNWYHPNINLIFQLKTEASVLGLKLCCGSQMADHLEIVLYLCLCYEMCQKIGIL